MTDGAGAEAGGGRGVARRYARLVAISAVAAVAASLAMVLEQVLRMLGLWPPGRWDVAAVVGFCGALELARRAPGWDFVPPGLRVAIERFVAGFDRLSERAMGGDRPLIATSALVGVLLALWAPHYLTWPFWTDHDVLATLALGWDRGRLPWRDQFGFQFPGEIELFWLLGRAGGWGSSRAFYAADLALLGGLLATVALACRACLGRWLPGLVACLTILGFYLSLPFTLVAQRDWHAAALSALAMMLLVGGSGWGSRLASALAFALALTIRPHAIVFLPGLILALRATRRDRGGGRWGAVIWTGGVALGVAVGFAPVVASGLAGDFFRALRVATGSGGAYGRSSLREMGHILALEVKDHGTIAELACLIAVARLGRDRASRRLAAILLAAVICALLYRPLHPVDHAYLRQPSALFRALAFAALADATIDSRLPSRLRLPAFAVLIALAVPWRSPYLAPRASFAGIAALATGSAPATAPPGCVAGFPPGGHPAYPYLWRDYLATLSYVRDRSGSATPVANLLTYFPYPSINAATGRVSPLPVETIGLVAWFPDIDFDARIATALRGSPDALVACDFGTPEGLFLRHLPRTLEMLKREYIPVARFGAIEIRRRPR